MSNPIEPQPSGDRAKPASSAGPTPSTACGPISPLTPALSPLRGEGAAMPAFGRTGSVGRERTFWIAAEPEQSGSVTSAATMPRQPTPARRAPSPLNGERAGVRGETEASPPALERTVGAETRVASKSAVRRPAACGCGSRDALRYPRLAHREQDSPNRSADILVRLGSRESRWRTKMSALPLVAAPPRCVFATYALCVEFQLSEVT